MNKELFKTKFCACFTCNEGGPRVGGDVWRCDGERPRLVQVLDWAILNRQPIEEVVSYAEQSVDVLE